MTGCEICRNIHVLHAFLAKWDPFHFSFGGFMTHNSVPMVTERPSDIEGTPPLGEYTATQSMIWLL